MGIIQGRCQVADYASEFQTLVADSSWNTPPLLDPVHRGLLNPIGVVLDCPNSSESFIDYHLREIDCNNTRQCSTLPTLRGHFFGAWPPPHCSPPHTSTTYWSQPPLLPWRRLCNWGKLNSSQRSQLAVTFLKFLSTKRLGLALKWWVLVNRTTSPNHFSRRSNCVHLVSPSMSLAGGFRGRQKLSGLETH